MFVKGVLKLGEGNEIENQINFTIVISPCPITKFESNPATIAAKVYTLGNAGEIFGFEMVQEDACGYPVTYTTSYSPS